MQSFCRKFKALKVYVTFTGRTVLYQSRGSTSARRDMDLKKELMENSWIEFTLSEQRIKFIYF